MASLVARPPAELHPGRHGLATGPAGARLRILAHRQLVNVIARRDAVGALRTAIRRGFDVDLPEQPLLVRGTPASFLWCGHRQWFAMADDGADLLTALRQHVGLSASLSEQSDSRLIVELSGPAARAVLAKLAPIDLHPRAFSVGATALTVLGHVPGQVTRTGDDPVYELMAFRSFADSFLESILMAGAEFGIDLAG